MRIAFEASLVTHQRVERLFAVMAEWRVTEIVCQTCKIHNIHVERAVSKEFLAMVQTGGNPSSDLRYFKGMRQTISEVIIFV